MTVATQTAVVDYIENGATLTFEVPFRFLSASDLVVSRRVNGAVAIVTPALVTGAGAANGGSITLSASIASAVLRIKRRTARVQPTDYTPGDDFPAESHELALDRQMLALQETDADIAGVALRAILTPEGETPGPLPSAAARAGKLLAFTSVGAVTVSTATLDSLEQLAALGFTPGLAQSAENVLFLASGFGARPRSLMSKARETVSVKDYGAPGDGNLYLLDDLFDTLAEAQAIYPFVDNIATWSLDSAGIQAAINAVKATAARGMVWFPDGFYVPSHSIKLPSFTYLVGSTGAVLQNQAGTLAGPLIVNEDPFALISAGVINLSGLGGSHFIKISVTGEVADLLFFRANAALQTVTQFETNYLQTTDFYHCNWDGGTGVFVSQHGFNSTGLVCNSVVFNHCRLTNHSNASFRGRGGAGIVFLGGSIEGGAFAGLPTIDIEDSAVVAFKGTYFENTREYLLRGRNSIVTFDDCSMYGYVTGGDFIGYLFDCPTGLTEFGTNSFYRQTIAPLNILVRGSNLLLDTKDSNVWFANSQGGGKFKSRQIAMTTVATFDLIDFIRQQGQFGLQNVQGTLMTQLMGFKADNVGIQSNRRYDVRAQATATSNIIVIPVLDLQDDNLGTALVTVQTKTGALPGAAQLEAVVENLSATLISYFQWSFDFTVLTTVSADRIQVAVG